MNVKEAQATLAKVRHLEDEVAKLEEDLAAARRDALELAPAAGKAKAAHRLGDASAKQQAADLRKRFGERQLDVTVLEAAQPSLEDALASALTELHEAAAVLEGECKQLVAKEIEERQNELRKLEPALHGIVSRLLALGSVPGAPSPGDLASDGGPGPLAQRRLRIGGFDLLKDEVKSDPAEEARVAREFGGLMEGARDAQRLCEAVQHRIAERHRHRMRVEADAHRLGVTTQRLGGQE